MAKHRHISVSFSVVALLLLTSSSPLSTVAEEDGGGSEGELEDERIIENTPITWKYKIMWTKSSLKAPRYDFSHFNDDIESVDCTSDVNCTAALPGVEAALEYNSKLPSSPYCVLPNDAASTTTSGSVNGKCTCGEGKCVSYSRESRTGDPFYYCGPCGYVGAKCTDHPCEHELAECRGGYCECIQEGTYYDLMYCYIPFYGQELLINVLIATVILLLCCATLAYGYRKLGNRHLRRGSFYMERGSGVGRRESPPDDTPPAYDDVIEKLPSYQDAMQMFEKSDVERGLENPAFEEDESSTKDSQMCQDSTTETPATLQNEAQGENAVLEEDTASPPSYEDKTTPKTEPVALPPLNDASTSLTQNGDTAIFSETSAQGNNESEDTRVDEQQGLGTQPIELLLYNALNTQQTTTSL